MQYLLDTHIFLWWLSDRKKISSKVKDIISDKENKIFVSSISIWELMIKKDLKNIDVPHNLLAILQSENITMLPFTAEEAIGVCDLPPLHNDPFDRALINQAKFNNLVFITKDNRILDYPIVSVKC